MPTDLLHLEMDYLINLVGIKIDFAFEYAQATVIKNAESDIFRFRVFFVNYIE